MGVVPAESGKELFLEKGIASSVACHSEVKKHS